MSRQNQAGSPAEARVEAHERRITRALLAAWWSNLAIWVALLILLFASLGLAYVPLGAWNFPVGVGIAVVKAALVGWFFMQINRGSALTRLTGLAGFVFVAALFTFTFSDLFTRF